MSQLFESFKFMDRGWDVRALENQPLRGVFVYSLLASFVLGMLASMMMYGLFRLHHFNWPMAILFPTLFLPAFRLSRLIYRRLGR